MEHEDSFEELQARLGIKLNVASLGKSEGLTPEEAKKCVVWIDMHVYMAGSLSLDVSAWNKPGAHNPRNKR